MGFFLPIFFKNFLFPVLFSPWNLVVFLGTFLVYISICVIWKEEDTKDLIQTVSPAFHIVTDYS